MKLLVRSAALAALCLIVTLAAYGQTTAQLVGTVTTGGSPLPGVTVTISSPQMQGERTAVSGEAGGYSFTALPPGDYTVKFELSGMQMVTQKLHIGPGQTGGANADMKVAAVAEAITVTAAAPSVLETPSVSANLTSKQVEQLPILRNVIQTALLAPGVNDNTPSGSQLSISGSPGYDNLVMVNGVSITENVRHQALGLYIEDAIQETTVLTGGISAEYGGFTGGVVNSITKSGGNQFTGSLRDSLTNPSWSSKTTGQQAAGTKLLDKISSVYEGTLGGFIMRDRLWFFGAGRDTKTDTQRALRAVPLGDGTKQSIDYTSNNKERRFEGKLTAQVTAKHNITASYLDRTSKTVGDVFTTTSYDLDQLSNREDPQHLKSAHYNGVLTNNWMVEAHYSNMFYGIGWGGGSKYTDFVRGTIVRNRADSNARFNSATFCGVCDKETRSNDGFNVKTNYFISSKNWGNQNIVAGVERFAEKRFANNYQSGSNFRVFVNSVARYNGVLYSTLNPGKSGSAALIFWTPIFELQRKDSSFGSDSAFINDRWDFNEHWNFNVGVRFDKNDAVDASGNKVSKDSKITPRLNATYDLQGNGKHRFTASYAEYASRIVDGPASSQAAAGSPATIYYQYLGPAINPAGTPVDQLVDTRTALAMVWDWFSHACNAQGKCGTDNLDLIRTTGPFGGTASVPGYTSRISSTLSSPYVREMTAGYGAQWMSNLVSRVDFIVKDWKDFYAYRVDASTPRETDFLGLPHDVSIVENSNDVTRKYRGIQLQSSWRPNRFNVGFNYTYATLKGNDEQESSTSGTVGNSPSAIYYPELNNFAQRLPQGYLSQDERHRARVWVGYDVPMPNVLGALNISVLQNYDSGLPYSAFQTIDVSDYADQLLKNSTYLAPATSPQYFFSKRGEYRLANVSSTNLSVNYRYPISRVELFVFGQLLNAFNQQAITGVNTSVSTADTSSNFAPFNPFTDTPKECPQGTPGSQCKAGGYNWQKGVNFGKAASSTSYQTPRTYRVSFGVRF